MKLLNLERFEGVDPSLALLNEREAAAVLTLKPATLTNWRHTGRYGLPYIRAGKAIRYRLSELLAFMERHTYRHTGEMKAGNGGRMASETTIEARKGPGDG